MGSWSGFREQHWMHPLSFTILAGKVLFFKRVCTRVCLYAGEGLVFWASINYLKTGLGSGTEIFGNDYGFHLGFLVIQNYYMSPLGWGWFGGFGLLFRFGFGFCLLLGFFWWVFLLLLLGGAFVILICALLELQQLARRGEMPLPMG